MCQFVASFPLQFGLAVSRRADVEAAVKANVSVTYQDMNAAEDKLVQGRQEIESRLTELKRLVERGGPVRHDPSPG